MELSPSLYSCLVRPQWLSKLYIHDILNSEFDFENKTVLDFGSGTGCNSLLFKPSNYLGVDTDASRVNFARKKYSDYRFALIKDYNLPIASDSLHLIIIVAVLHHIPTEDLTKYIHEFRRVLKPDGEIIVLEPYYCNRHKLNNSFMRIFDNGKFIRNEEEYLSLFEQGTFSTEVKRKFTKILYNEIFFSAVPK